MDARAQGGYQLMEEIELAAAYGYPPPNLGEVLYWKYCNPSFRTPDYRFDIVAFLRSTEQPPIVAIILDYFSE